MATVDFFENRDVYQYFRLPDFGGGLRALGGAFVGRPELVDGGEGVVEAFGGKRFEMGHLRVGIGRREFGGDELRLQPGHR